MPLLRFFRAKAIYESSIRLISHHISDPCGEPMRKKWLIFCDRSDSYSSFASLNAILIAAFASASAKLHGNPRQSLGEKSLPENAKNIFRRAIDC